MAIRVGTLGNDSILGTSGDDFLFGFAGNDTLNGGAGADILEGGLGNDLYVVDNIEDVVIESNALATEVDTVQSSISWSIDTGGEASFVENLTLTGVANITGTGNSLRNVIIGNSGENQIFGGGGNDSIDGGGGNDNLDGGAGDDTLIGGEGNDVLNGGIGTDLLVGGAGNDVYFLDSAGDQIVETANNGVDTALSTISRVLDNNVENLQLLGNASISGFGNTLANIITGNSGDNVLTGEGGNDVLNGGDGKDVLLGGADSDTLVGGIGNDLLDGGAGVDNLDGGSGGDVYVVDNASDVVLESSSLASEIDTVRAIGLSWTLGTNLENLTLLGTQNTTGIGNELNNFIVGSVGNNVLIGNDGNDSLDGALGADTLNGGLGNDTYTVDSVLDVIAGEDSNLLQIDGISSWIDWSLDTRADCVNIENLTLLGFALAGTGNGRNNRIVGNQEDNELFGLGGQDTGRRPGH
jgi:Ca2+-binding RTX toxin-like protein